MAKILIGYFIFVALFTLIVPIHSLENTNCSALDAPLCKYGFRRERNGTSAIYEIQQSIDKCIFFPTEYGFYQSVTIQCLGNGSFIFQKGKNFTIERLLVRKCKISLYLVDSVFYSDIQEVILDDSVNEFVQCLEDVWIFVLVTNLHFLSSVVRRDNGILSRYRWYFLRRLTIKGWVYSFTFNTYCTTPNCICIYICIWYIKYNILPIYVSLDIPAYHPRAFTL